MPSEGLHLGNLPGVESSRISIGNAVANLYSRTNVLLSRFSFCTPDVLYRLFKAHCVIAYGSQLWDFQKEFVNDYFVAWRKCVRRVWGIPYTTHTNLLSAICRDKDIDIQLLSRSINFIRNAVSSSNLLLKLCAGLVIQGSSSSVANTTAALSDNLTVDGNILCFSCFNLFDCGPSVC